MESTHIVHCRAPNEYFFKEGCFITEWMNNPCEDAVSIARARVEPGVTTHWHRLEGITERYVILQGEGRVEIGTLAPEKVLPGALVIIPAGERQRISNAGSEDLIFLAVCTPRFRPECYRAE